jgi:2-keto-4-pentenoate hydratase/2-oxohepta-3-ene-1,7-dioic acid hydratase in catechol pathway
MSLADLQPVIRELLAIHSAFQRCGFDAGDIFVTPHGICPHTGERQAAVVLKQGDKELVITAGAPFPGCDGDFHRYRQGAVTKWNAATTPERDAVTHGIPRTRR